MNRKERGKFYLYILKNKLAIILIILLLAVAGYRVSEDIPKGVLPNIFFPRIEVSIDNGHVPISQMLYSVTKPTEEALKSVQDVDKIVSSTSVGSTEINLYFNWSINPYLAYQLVQAKVADIKNSLNKNAKITVRQATPSIYPISIYAIGSNSLNRAKLTEKLYYELKPVMLSVKGVYDIQIKAPTRSEYKLILDSKKIAEYNLNINNIIKKIEAQNSIEFLGVVDSKHREYILSLNQKIKDSSKILDLKLDLGNNQNVKLSQIASLLEGENIIKKYSGSSRFKNSVVFNLLRQPNANSLDVQREFNKKIKILNNKLLKEGIKIEKFYDGTEFIKEAISSVVEAIILGSIIAIIVVLIFLKKFRLSLISLIVIPITFSITMIGMKLTGIDINIFSLGGMVASLGGLIDHLLIVIESIERNYKDNKSKKEAIIDGSKDILPIMSVATILSILIFIPLLMVSGIVGEFFKQLAIVLVVTYFVSQLIAIFLTPIIAYIALPHQESNRKIGFIDRVIYRYVNFLRKSFKYAWISIPLILISLYISFYLYKIIPSTFLPEWDEGNIVVDVVMPTDITLKDSKYEFLEIGKILSSIDEVQGWTLRIGTGLGGLNKPINQGDFLVTLKTNHKKSSQEVIEEIHKKVEDKIKNLQELGVSQVLEDRLGDIMGADAPISVMLFGSNSDELIKEGYRLQKLLRKIKDVEEVNVITSYASPSIDIKVKSEAKSIYGINENMIKNQIELLYYGKIVASVADGEKLINLRVIVNRDTTDPIEYLKNNLKIYSPKLKEKILLSNLVDIKYRDKVAEVTHYNLSPVCILGVRFKGDDMLKVVKDISTTLSKSNIPNSITTDIAGLYKEQQKSFQEMSLVIIFAILIIFIGLLLNFSSIKIAFSIFISLLLTTTGVFLALFLAHKPLDIMAFMGILIVLSIVINNNVLIFDFYHISKKDSNIEKQLEAISLRAKPILMTMLSNALALLPIALAIGTGTEIIQDLAIAIMGGLLFAIIVNLFITPMFFYSLEGDKK